MTLETFVVAPLSVLPLFPPVSSAPKRRFGLRSPASPRVVSGRELDARAACARREPVFDVFLLLFISRLLDRRMDFVAKLKEVNPVHLGVGLLVGIIFG